MTGELLVTGLGLASLVSVVGSALLLSRAASPALPDGRSQGTNPSTNASLGPALASGEQGSQLTQGAALRTPRAREPSASTSGVVPAPRAADEFEEAVQHTQRLEMVGRLAGGIAHDFNNTLTVILSYGELMKARFGPGHPVSELANHVVEAAEHGAALTKQLLTFSRRQVIKPRPVEMRQLLGATERTLARVIPRTIQVHPSQGEDELFVTLDGLQLQQAVLNLALNARDAMPLGGDLYLRVEAVDVGPGDLPGLLPGPYVVVRVRDTGLGISPDVLPHIFEPFFSTKEPGRGTGLGLSNVREIAEASGGHVTVESELGRGSEFSLYFPRVEARPSGVQPKVPSESAPRARLLLVEDDRQVREIIRTMLVEGDYLVRMAETGSEALEILAHEPMDLVCTDFGVPDMPGITLVDRLRKAYPELPVVVCSACGSDPEVSRRVMAGEVWFLAKPFVRSDLLEVVQRALAPRTRIKQSPASRG